MSEKNIRARPNDGGLRTDMGPGMSRQDPNVTTAQLVRENFWLRELLQEQIAGLIQRMEGADNAVKLLQAFADRTPTTMDVQHEVTSLRGVLLEKISGIKTQLADRDVQTEKASRDVKSAVDAAFAAAKEAVAEQNKSNALAIAKSEAGFTKQLDMLGEANKTNMRSVDDKINDMKERVTIIESRTSVTDPSTQISLAEVKRDLARITSAGDTSAGGVAANKVMMSSIISIIGLVIAVATAVIMAAKAFM
jgi:hypothetical protein